MYTNLENIWYSYHHHQLSQYREFQIKTSKMLQYPIPEKKALWGTEASVVFITQCKLLIGELIISCNSDYIYVRMKIKH